MTRGDINLSAIRMFAKDADKTAKFYEALGYEMLGPNPDDLKKMGFPLYMGAHSSGQGVQIEIFQLVPESSMNVGQVDSTLCIRVGDVEHVIAELKVLGLLSEVAEPGAGQPPHRMLQVWTQEHGMSKGIGLLQDPDGRAVYLHVGNYCAMKIDATTPWTPLSTKGTEYFVGQSVRYEGGLYRCLRDHIATSECPPPQCPELWRYVKKAAG